MFNILTDLTLTKSKRSIISLARSAKWTWLIILAVTIMVYLPSLSGPFVFDDIQFIVNNQARREIELTPRRLLGSRGLSSLTFDISYALGQLNTTGYHLVNLFIHLIATSLVYGLTLELAQYLDRSPPVIKKMPTAVLAATLAASIFALHPLQTQAVTYITQRIASLATMFYLLSLWSYVKFRLSRQHWAKYTLAVISLLATIAAMHCKEISFTIPIAILLLEFFFFSPDNNSFWRRWYKLLPWLLTLVIIPLYVVGITEYLFPSPMDVNTRSTSPLLDKINPQTMISSAKETNTISRGTYFLTQINVVRTYLRLMVWPRGQSIDWDYPLSHSLGEAKTALSLGLHVTLIVLAWWLWRRQLKLAAGGVFFFYLALSVESSLIPITDVMFEHRVYPAMLGFALLVASLVTKVLLLIPANRRWRVTVGGVLILWLTLSLATWRRNLVWADERTLWANTLTKVPRGSRPLNNLGLSYLMEKKYDEAEDLFLRAAKFHPDEVEAYVNLASLYGQTHQYQRSIEASDKALALNKREVSAYINKANAYLARHDWQTAKETYRQALPHDPHNASIWAGLGDASVGLGERNEAITLYEQAIALDNSQANWFNRLGALYAMSRRFNEAHDAFIKALRLDPDLLPAKNNLLRLDKDSQLSQ